MDNDNVVPIRANTKPLFNGELRQRMEESISPYTQQRSEAVNAFEQAICSFIVSKVRDFATLVGEKVGKAILAKTS